MGLFHGYGSFLWILEYNPCMIIAYLVANYNSNRQHFSNLDVPFRFIAFPDIRRMEGHVPLDPSSFSLGHASRANSLPEGSLRSLISHFYQRSVSKSQKGLSQMGILGFIPTQRQQKNQDQSFDLTLVFGVWLPIVFTNCECYEAAPFLWKRHGTQHDPSESRTSRRFAASPREKAPWLGRSRS